MKNNSLRCQLRATQLVTASLELLHLELQQSDCVAETEFTLGNVVQNISFIKTLFLVLLLLLLLCFVLFSPLRRAGYLVYQIYSYTRQMYLSNLHIKKILHLLYICIYISSFYMQIWHSFTVVLNFFFYFSLKYYFNYSKR